MKQVVAHARKKKQAQAVVKQHAQVLSKEEQVQYNNFWGGVEASMLLQNHQLRHAAEKKEENKDNADTVILLFSFSIFMIAFYFNFTVFVP